MKKIWRPRKRDKACYDWAIAQGHSKMIAHLLSGRYSNVDELNMALTSTIKDIDKPDSLPDIDKAAKRIAKAIKEGEVIGIETDHDADGVTSHSVIMEVLTDIIGHPKDKIRSYIGHRLKEGYGLSESVANRILQDNVRPTLVITADNGSSDEERIAKLRRHGIDVIVTDHHEIPVEGIPASAYAVVSPAREDSNYPDRLIAGCMVAFLTMAATRQELIHLGYFQTPPPSIASVLDFVALGTVADCVSMSRSKNNRRIVERGLQLINLNKRPCWQALRSYLGNDKKTFTAEDLGFTVGPRINARGRLDEAMMGVHFLLTKDPVEAFKLADLLDQENNERKTIEKTLKELAMAIAVAYVDKGYQSLVIFLEDGHPGVHGIVSSRITEAFGRPSIIISPKQDDDKYVSASARGVPGFHVRQALQTVADNNPGLLTKFGGHTGAAGMTFERKDIDRFREEFEKAARNQIVEQAIIIGPTIQMDGVLPHNLIKLETIDEYSILEPFGREMDPPLFASKFKIASAKRIGVNKDHLKLTLKAGDALIDGVWFNARIDGKTVENGDEPEKCLLFSLSKNHFRGKVNLQLLIQDMQ